LPANPIERSDFLEEGQRFSVAAEKDVLTVVDELAGLTIDERRRTAPESTARLEHKYSGSISSETHAST
jgi:hypothetical protein